MTVLNGTKKSDGFKLSVYSLLQRNAIKYRNHLAFQSEEKEYSWGELFDFICKVAYGLSKKGINRDSQVLIVLDKKIESTVVLYSLFLLGCKVFVTNLRTCDRVISEEYHINVVIGNETNRQINSTVETWSIRLIMEECLRGETPAIDFALFENNTNTAFIVLFTSGTLGDAKGIQLSQYSYLKNALRFAHCLRIKNSDKYSLVTPLHHCFGIINILSALTKGACIFFPVSNHYDIVISSISRYKCSVLNAVPTFFLGLQKFKSFNAENIDSIKKGVMAGGNYSAEQFIDITNCFHMNLLSSYGLTECCATVTFSSYQGDLREKANSVGKFIPGICGSIQDSHGNELPVNHHGEICVKGYPLMKGYYDNGKLISDFVDANRWFHTGDLGYIDSDNNLHIVDRLKNIIICSGENISPKKVEDRFLQLSYVDECMVIGIKDNYYGEIPCAVIKSSDSEITSGNVNKITEYLNEDLERFEIPKKILVVEDIPKNENGKYDRAAVRKLFDS